MKLTVLGTSAAYAEAGRACSGYLISDGKTKILLDLGSGVLSNLQRHMNISDLNAIFISHTHPDHFLDIYGMRYLLEYDLKPERPLSVFGPKGLKETIISLQPESKAVFENLFEFNEISEENKIKIKDFEISTSKAKHPLPTLMYSVRSEGKNIFYTADTGAFKGLQEIVKGSDLLLCEATYLKSASPSDVHLRTNDIAEFAQAAGISKVVLTHFWPGTDRLRSKFEVEQSFDGEVTIANENDVLNV
jgi:ribonuclease BN (tRNA processing enzyme)